MTATMYLKNVLMVVGSYENVRPKSTSCALNLLDDPSQNES